MATAGTNYAIGDQLVVPNVNNLPPARFEVLTLDGGTGVGTLRQLSSGAYAQRVTAAVVNNGGSGYTTGQIIEVVGGTGRELCKLEVTAVAGAVTSLAVYESGGSYSVNPAATGAATDSSVGTGSGTGCTVNLTFSSEPTNGASTTSNGSGTGCELNFTLVDTGWTVERSTNNTLVNGVADEREVVLVADALGFTNKPRIAFVTGSTGAGPARYFAACYGLVNFNPANALDDATHNISGNGSTAASPSLNEAYMLFDEDNVQPLTFRFAIDDRRMCGFYNLNPQASATDDNNDMQFHFGKLDANATENEDPYPNTVITHASAVNINPSAVDVRITGLSEVRRPGVGLECGAVFYRAETQTWVKINNPFQSGAGATEQHIILPMGRHADISDGDNDNFQTGGAPTFTDGVFQADRSPAGEKLVTCPGTVRKIPRIPLTLSSRPGGTSVDLTLDTVRGDLAGCFLVYNSDENGTRFADFSEDILEDPDGTRYTVCQTGSSNEQYHYVAFRQDF